MDIPHIHIKKSTKLNIIGEPTDSLEAAPVAEKVALLVNEFPYIKPKLEIAEGDNVKIGQPLFHDKLCPELKFVSPGAGTISQIKRGHRRAILNISIELNKEEEYLTFPPIQSADIDKLDANAVKDQLLQGGLWPYIKERPFSKIANPHSSPRSIFINGMATEPHSAKTEILLLNQKNEFHAGVKVLKKLTEGNVYLSIERGDIENIAAFQNLQDVSIHEFTGHHPAGNTSVHIFNIDPLKKGDIVWTVDAYEVALIGRFILEGQFPIERTITIAGPSVKKPAHYVTRLGADIASITNNNVEKDTLTYLSGSVLSGFLNSKDGYLGFWKANLTILRSGKTREFLGWLSPGPNKISLSRAFLSALSPDRALPVTTNIHGSLRAIIATDLYDKYLPLDIYAVPLVKAILAEDIERAEQLGLLECVPEDFALASFMCPSKIDLCQIIQNGLDMAKKELD